MEQQVFCRCHKPGIPCRARVSWRRPSPAAGAGCPVGVVDPGCRPGSTTHAKAVSSTQHLTIQPIMPWLSGIFERATVDGWRAYPAAQTFRPSTGCRAASADGAMPSAESKLRNQNVFSQVHSVHTIWTELKDRRLTVQHIGDLAPRLGRPRPLPGEGASQPHSARRSHPLRMRRAQPSSWRSTAVRERPPDPEQQSATPEASAPEPAIAPCNCRAATDQPARPQPQRYALPWGAPDGRVVGWVGLEPTTYGLKVRSSNQQIGRAHV